LAVYLFVRNHIHHSGEDSRYAAMRRKGGESWWYVSFVKVFMPQSVVQWIISTPLLLAVQQSADNQALSLSMLDYAGLTCFSVGLVCETVADWQLSSFMSARKQSPDTTPQLLTTGLWKCSRHPNYWAESMVWWGLWLLCHPSSVFPYSLITIYAPLLMYYCLLRITGASLLESHSLRKKPGFEEWKKATPEFTPNFRKLFS